MRRPLARPASEREVVMATKDVGDQAVITTQERTLGTAEMINNLRAPRVCWRNPASTATMMGGMS